MAFLFLFEIVYLDIGFNGKGLWGITGIWNIEKNKKTIEIK